MSLSEKDQKNLENSKMFLSISRYVIITLSIIGAILAPYLMGGKFLWISFGLLAMGISATSILGSIWTLISTVATILDR